jgi:diguanylate cyclase (GGDEF)-like protein
VAKRPRPGAGNIARTPYIRTPRASNAVSVPADNFTVGLRSALHPRDTVGAARAFFSLYTSGAVVALIGALASERVTHSTLWYWSFAASLAGVVIAAWLLRHVQDGRSLVWTTAPLSSLAVVIALCVALPDPSLHSEYFLWFPAMYFARQLPRRYAWAGIATCALTAAVIYAVRFDTRTALLQTIYFDVTLVVVTVRLTLTAQRFDRKLSHAERLATVDPLTGLLTRPALEAATQSTLAVLGSQRGAALALIDVDHFKIINDTYGHPAGDTVLSKIGAILRSECRSSDVIARIGGDELAVLFTDLPFDMVYARVDALRVAVGAHSFDLGSGADTQTQVTIAIGVSHSQNGATTLAGIYSQADRALYAAKRRGRNCTEIFQATDDEQAGHLLGANAHAK